ncbi:MAG: M20/M25/M40 family metallo-hydrolase, partial [Thermoflexales bacterium]|nr:M20/M25/M40 family metallo-hydrolase [Thermoflexales bacterium]
MSLPDLLSALVAINSINPSLVAGAPGERALIDFVAHWLRERGIATEVIAAGTDVDRPSLLARVPGHGIGRSLALYAHADTVGLGEAVDALTPRRVDGRLHGRGAYDMKGSLAALLRVLEGAALNPLD